MDEAPFRNTQSLEKKQIFRPGEPVPASGIYEGHHADGKVERRAVLRGTRFPECPVCGKDL